MNVKFKKIIKDSVNECKNYKKSTKIFLMNVGKNFKKSTKIMLRNVKI